MKTILLAAVVLVVIFLGLGFVVSNTSEGKQKSEDRRAIAYCRERAVKDAAGNKVAENLVLGACDNMAAEFKQKYGFEP